MNYQNLSEKPKDFLVKNKVLILTLFLFAIFLSPVSAQQGAQLKISRENYEAGETIQAELTFSKVPIKDFDISLVKDEIKIPVGAIAIKLSDKRYFIYFDIPNTIGKGEYEVSINNIIYLVDGNLVESSVSQKISINSINPAFYWLKDQKKEIIEEIVFSTAALANAGLNPSSNELLEKQSSLGCFPKENCNVKDTALGLIALNSLDLDAAKSLNWLKGAQNDISLGSFKVIINSQSSGTCQINEDSLDIISGLGEKDVTGETQINVDCSSLPSVNIKLTHSYLGNSFDLQSTSQKQATFNINDKGCFGISYKSNCDYESSLYAAYALEKLQQNNEKVLIWLKENYDEFTTLHHAFLVLMDDFAYSKEWLINNQLSRGAWSKKALSLDTTEDLFTTSIAAWALRPTPYGEDGLRLLKDKESLDNWNNDILLTSQILFFSFQDEKIQPSLSLNPGIIAVFKNQKDPIRLLLSNKGDSQLNVKINAKQGVTVDKSSTIINSRETRTILMTIDTGLITESSVEIIYNDKLYIIPVIISDEIQSYSTNPLRFITEKSSIKFTILSKETKEGDIKFKNFGDQTLTEVKLALSGKLLEIVALDTASFSQINPNETKNVFARINKNKNPLSGDYKGNLTIISKEGYASVLALEVEITDFKSSQVEIKSESDVKQETEEEKVNETQEEIQEERKSALPIAIIILVILILAVLTFYIIKKKKPRKSKKVEVNFPKPTESARFKEHLRRLEELKK